MNKTNQFEWELSAKPTSLSETASDKKQLRFNRISMIPVSSIESNPVAVRKRYDKVAILSLADSIRRHGLLQPILVKKINKSFLDKPRYRCVVGERRLRAYQMLSYLEIPCFVISSDRSDDTELSLIENVVRKDLDIFECGASLFLACVAKNMSSKELASQLSTSQSEIMRKINLLQFSDEEQMFILLNHLTEQHAQALLKISDVILRTKVMELIVERGYSPLKAEEYINAILCEHPEPISSEPEDVAMKSFLCDLTQSLAQLQKQGTPATLEEFEHESEMQFLIRVPKK